jgi:hypothetical protein
MATFPQLLWRSALVCELEPLYSARLIDGFVGLLRNLGGCGKKALYGYTRVGTKALIETCTFLACARAMP